MSENNLKNNDTKKDAANKVEITFSKSNTTADYFKKLTDQNMNTNEAIQEVCKAFDEFCSKTTDVDYLIERYTELYNHNRVTKPMAFSLIAVLISVLANQLIDIFKQFLNWGTNGDTLIGIIVNMILSAIIAVAVVISITIVFKELKTTYRSYDVFVLPYERDRIYNELTDRGYFLEKEE